MLTAIKKIIQIWCKAILSINLFAKAYKVFFFFFFLTYFLLFHLFLHHLVLVLDHHSVGYLSVWRDSLLTCCLACRAYYSGFDGLNPFTPRKDCFGMSLLDGEPKQEYLEELKSYLKCEFILLCRKNSQPLNQTGVPFEFIFTKRPFFH